MASGALLVKFQSLYTNAGRQIGAWNDHQAHCLALLSAVANIISRLPLLQDQKYLGVLASLVGYQDKLVAKQVEMLERLMGELHAAVGAMGAAVSALGKLARDGERLARSVQSATPVTDRAGPSPSVLQCSTGLQDIWQMYQTGLHLKRVLVNEITYDSTEDDLRELRCCFAAQPNIKTSEIKDILYRVTATVING